jgi:membrane-bound ClpP family serine protease
MFWLIIAVLLLIGFLFLVLEILVIPGTGVAGIIGFVLIGIAVWQSYAYYGATTGHLILGLSIVLTFVTLAVSLRAKTWRRVALNSSISSRVNVIADIDVKAGDTGEAISRLAPGGKALINGNYYEVSSIDEFIDQGTEITVVKVINNKIKVKRKK